MMIRSADFTRLRRNFKFIDSYFAEQHAEKYPEEFYSRE